MQSGGCEAGERTTMAGAGPGAPPSMVARGGRELPDGYVICSKCNATAMRRGASQKFCRACSEIESRAQKGRIESKHDHAPDSRAERRRALAEERRTAGAGRSERASMSWPAECEPSLEWTVRVAVPFSYAMSKNAIWRSVGAGHVVLREESKALRESLMWEVKAALGAIPIRQNRLWLDIMVEKPDHRGDALNVVDLVADAVKVATGLDDRWYSMRRLDWRVCKDRPRLIVGLGQEAVADALVCSYCGRVLELDSFTKNRSGPLGRSRVCIECSRASDKLRRAARKERAS